MSMETKGPGQEVITPDMEAAKARVISYLNSGKADNAKRVSDAAGLTPEILQSQEIRDALKRQIVENFSWGILHVAADQQAMFPLPEKEYLAAALEGTIDALSNGHIDKIEFIKRTEPDFPKDLLQSAELRAAAEKGVEVLVAKGESRARAEEMVRQLFEEK
ncbi:hypothetical protein EPO34_03760 [Patescibacteria group bacterium]|nr:MAG: hypothetical protein EPO34_03760 [Patescibacteria group bacterium]